MPIKLPRGLGALGFLPGFVSRSKQGSAAAPRRTAPQSPPELSSRRASAGSSPAAGNCAHPRPRAALPAGTQVTLQELLNLEHRLNASSGTAGMHSPLAKSPDESRAAWPGKKAPLKNPQLGKLDAAGTLVGHHCRTQPLQPHEYQQVGYQLGAKLNGDAITDPDQRRQLVDGTQTAHEVRMALKHGRGNVGVDTIASGGHNGIGASVSYRKGGTSNCVRGRNIRSGAALAVGAGNCDQHGDIAARLHAKRLMPGETIQTVTIQGLPNPETSEEDPHTWAEVHTKSEEKGKELEPIVIDPWANGPAARLQDTAWVPFQKEKTIDAVFDAVSGKQHLEDTEKIARQFSPGGQYHAGFLSEVEYKRQQPTAWEQYEEPQVIAPQFAADARKKLASMSAFGQEIVAAGTAREAYGLSVKEATKLTTTTQIIDQALSLDKQRRPPVVKPSS